MLSPVTGLNQMLSHVPGLRQMSRYSIISSLRGLIRLYSVHNMSVCRTLHDFND